MFTFNNELKKITEKEVEEQESLSQDLLVNLKPKCTWNSIHNTDWPVRPQHAFIELMHWSKTVFGDYISKNSINLECADHNRIMIDGQFIEFCKQQSITIECLMRDSFSSWKTDNDYEGFMMQGVFKITKGNLSFLHCALFHKGNQNEDEVSFWVIFDRKDFSDYVKLRNEYDVWLQARDRSSQEIYVVGGSPIPYERNLSWDDLFLEENLKTEIRNSVEGFLAAKPIYEKANIVWRRGILLMGTPGCGKSSCIKTIIANYDFKPVTVMPSSQTNDDIIAEAFEYAQEQSPALLYIEDLDTLLNNNVTLSHFLNLMDGVTSKNGIFVIATANDPSKLNEAILDRPSRFDRKWEFPLPNEELTISYLTKWFGKALKAKEYKTLAASCISKKMSFAYIKELYITAAYSALADGREVPNYKDAKVAIKQLLRDKAQVENGFEFEAYDDGKIGI